MCFSSPLTKPSITTTPDNKAREKDGNSPEHTNILLTREKKFPTVEEKKFLSISKPERMKST